MSEHVGKLVLMLIAGWAIMVLPVVALFITPTPNPRTWGPVWGVLVLLYFVACALA